MPEEREREKEDRPSEWGLDRGTPWGGGGSNESAGNLLSGGPGSPPDDAGRSDEFSSRDGDPGLSDGPYAGDPAGPGDSGVPDGSSDDASGSGDPGLSGSSSSDYETGLGGNQGAQDDPAFGGGGHMGDPFEPSDPGSWRDSPPDA